MIMFNDRLAGVFTGAVGVCAEFISVRMRYYLYIGVHTKHILITNHVSMASQFPSSNLEKIRDECHQAFALFPFKKKKLLRRDY